MVLELTYPELAEAGGWRRCVVWVLLGSGHWQFLVFEMGESCFS